MKLERTAAIGSGGLKSCIDDLIKFSKFTTLLNDDKILIAGGQETTDTIELDEDCLPTCQAKIVGMFDNDYLPESLNNFGYIFNINTKNMTKTALLSEKLAFSPNNIIKIIIWKFIDT